MTERLRSSSFFALALALGALAAPRLAAAHDLWLLPPTSPAVVGQAVEIRVTQGMNFPGDDAAPKVDRFAHAYAIDPDGRRIELKRKAPRGDAGILEFVPEKPGVYAVAVDTAPKIIELDAANFNHYLVADGMPHVFTARHRDGELTQPAKEQYQKSVKLLLRVQDVLSSTPTTKQGLEIVPLADPFTRRIGETLRIRVDLDGRPLQGAHVGFDLPNDGPEPTGTVRTNASGEALIPIVQTGVMTLRLTHMTRPKQKTHEWQSHWTTLTFTIPSAPTRASGFREAVERVTVTHGGPGPFVMAGYRIGLDALARLGASRGVRRLRVRHHSPDAVQWSCVVDGVQAATGASTGKLNLERLTIAGQEVITEIWDGASKRRLRYRLTPAFVKRYLNRPHDEAPAAAREIASLSSGAIFIVTETNADR